jgi:hypothetical protein
MQFHWVVWLFGLFLIFTGVKLAISSDAAVEPDRNLLIRLLRRVLPVTSGFRGQRFFVRQEGRIWATPLLIALLCLEASDIIFAIDSVPAVFALTREPFIVFTSNVFAILARGHRRRAACLRRAVGGVPQTAGGGGGRPEVGARLVRGSSARLRLALRLARRRDPVSEYRRAAPCSP